MNVLKTLLINLYVVSFLGSLTENPFFQVVGKLVPETKVNGASGREVNIWGMSCPTD